MVARLDWVLGCRCNCKKSEKINLLLLIFGMKIEKPFILISLLQNFNLYLAPDLLVISPFILFYFIFLGQPSVCELLQQT
jgi:hypothetical protein